MFASARATWAPSGAPRFWTVPVEGGVEEPMPLPRGYQGKISAGRHAHRLSHEQLVGRGAPQLSRRPEPPDLDRRSQDVRSRLAAVDRFEGHGSGLGRRHGVLHLRSRRRRQRLVVRHASRRSSTQVTKFTDFDVKSLDAGARRGRVRAGRLHSRARSEDRQDEHVVNITATGDFPVDDAALGGRHQPHDEHGALADRQARRWSKRAARSSRSRRRRATSATSRNSSGSAERDPAWSPDGKWISYFSDKSGEYKLVIEAQDGLTPPREIALPKPTHYYTPSWSPDSKKLLYTDTNLNVWVLDVASGQAKIVGNDPWMVPTRTLNPVVEPGLEVGRVREPPELAVSRDLRRATSRPARRSRSPTASPTRCGRRGTRAASISGSSRRPTSVCARSGST